MPIKCGNHRPAGDSDTTGYGTHMTTTPEEPMPEPEVVPSGDPPPIDPSEDPNLDPQTKPAPDLRP